MDIRTKLSELLRMLEDRISICLNDYEFWLQDSKKVILTIDFAQSVLFIYS